MTKGRQFLDGDNAAAFLSITVDQLRMLVDRGQIARSVPAGSPRGSLIFRRSELLRWLKATGRRPNFKRPITTETIVNVKNESL
jgi:hypothetical protein